MIHAKKILPQHFEALREGTKTYELRKEQPDEPRYAVGDYLALNEFDPGRHATVDEQYTGRCLLFRISHVLRDDERLAKDCVALGLIKMPLCFEDLKDGVRLSFQ